MAMKRSSGGRDIRGADLVGIGDGIGDFPVGMGSIVAFWAWVPDFACPADLARGPGGGIDFCGPR